MYVDKQFGGDKTFLDQFHHSFRRKKGGYFDGYKSINKFIYM